MRSISSFACLLALLLASLPLPAQAAALQGIVEVNGVRLQYLDWGGSGPPLILVHGLADTAYVFDDIAPAFTDRFHVLAYTRRGSAGSQEKGPYDIDTLTTDLAGFMDALGLARADLVGLSAGGDDITRLAIVHPERVGRLVYLDAAYDWASPEFEAAVKALPLGFFDLPASATQSLQGWRDYQQALQYPHLDDMQRVESNLRQKVILHSDGSVQARPPKPVVDAIYAAIWQNESHDYSRLRAPALAIYADTLYDLDIPDPQRRAKLLAYEKGYWAPLQAKAIEKVRRQLANVEIVRIHGPHCNFFLTDRQEMVATMRRFLLPAAPSPR